MRGRNNQSEQQPIVTSSRGQSLGELTNGDGVEVEPVTNMDAVALEAFMNENVLIMVHKTNEKGAIDPICPNVNNKNMPIFRGKETLVKRKYVEALIMAHNVDYKQQINLQSPDQFEMVKVATPSYPFSVIEDSNRGYAWKKRMEEQRDRQV